MELVDVPGPDRMSVTSFTAPHAWRRNVHASIWRFAVRKSIYAPCVILNGV